MDDLDKKIEEAKKKLGIESHKPKKNGHWKKLGEINQAIKRCRKGSERYSTLYSQRKYLLGRLVERVWSASGKEDSSYESPEEEEDYYFDDEDLDEVLGSKKRKYYVGCGIIPGAKIYLGEDMEQWSCDTNEESCPHHYDCRYSDFNGPSNEIPEVEARYKVLDRL